MKPCGGILAATLMVVVVAALAPGVLACGGTYLEETGTIKSPNYPKKYPNNQHCVYIIKASADARLKFWCEKMNLEFSLGCVKDWLAVNGVYTCGKNKLKDIYGEGELRVEFSSDNKVNKRNGFVCKYQRVTGGPYIATQRTTEACNPPLSTKYNYDEVLHKSLLFYEAQRSGFLPDSQRVTWRHDSATDDALDAKTNLKVDLEGGYYDAGDYIKFGYPMAGAATVLAWGAVEYGAAYNASGEMGHMMAAVKWAADYFLKAHVSPNVFYGQVGKGTLDHNYWGRPEDMTMNRPAYKITKNKPGSDLAGETAAALAATAILFHDADSTYSQNCLQHARQLYNFANKYRGKYAKSITDAVQFYDSYGVYDDELAWAAAWLYRATGETHYLQEAKQHYSKINTQWVSEFSWAEKAPGAMVLLAQLADAVDKPTYRNHLQAFCNKMSKNTKKTPKGLLFISKWGTLRYAANVAFVCLRAADLGINTAEYRLFAQKQIDYMLGDGGRSYVIGFGQNPPQRPHHASSSCKDPPASCTWTDYQSSLPNPQVLYGALVGGPDENDNFSDVRSDFITNEVTCDYNAGFQSAVAGLRQLTSCNGQSNAMTTPQITTTDKGGDTICAVVTQTSEWKGNYQAKLVITVPVNTTSWTLALTFSDLVTKFQVWVATASPTPSINIDLTNKSYNGEQNAGDTLAIDFWVTYSFGVKPTLSYLTFNKRPICVN